MAVNSPNSPRQKMINLMYLVFIAMLALNVPSEVLDGFELVEESLLRSVKSSTSRNDLIFNDLETYHTTNPEKTKVWYDLAKQVKVKSDSLYNYTEDLKIRIVKKADGEKGDPEKLKNQADLNASNEIMFESGKNEAKILKSDIDSYRNFVVSLISDSSKKRIIENNLSTEPSKKAKRDKQSWEESMFMQMPLAAAVTLLTKIQNDVRYAEGEVLSDLLKNIDVSDFRVNNIKAYVIPESQIVMRGGSYSANLVLSAEDSTQHPKVFVNGRFLPEELNGLFKVGAGSTGTFPVTGYIEMARGDGSTMRKEFSTQYYVVEPTATVAPTMMNVLYAGIDNPIQIAVPNTPSQNVSATITNGTLTRNGERWIAKPSKVGTDAIIAVTAKMSDGRSQEMAKIKFRVRALPDPMAFLDMKDASGNPTKFRGGRLSKSVLNGVDVLKAAIDDGLLDIDFSVLSFQVLIIDNLGNSRREVSDGNKFSSQQKSLIRGLERGKFFLVREIKVKGPDGIERILPAPLEVTVN